MPTRAEYDAIFETERVREYPVVDALEKRLGYAIDRAWLERVARVLACPLKKNPPCWQHGRVIYAVLRSRLRAFEPGRDDLSLLDVGTAKGFSALCARRALQDAGQDGDVWSVDVIAPQSRERRNTVVEVDWPRTLYETIDHAGEEVVLKDVMQVFFLQSTGVDWLRGNGGQRVHFAFVDGKHRNDVVEEELLLLSKAQRPGDRIVVDDVQIEGVRRAVETSRVRYDFEVIAPIPGRREYAVGTRRS